MRFVSINRLLRRNLGFLDTPRPFTLLNAGCSALRLKFNLRSTCGERTGPDRFPRGARFFGRSSADLLALIWPMRAFYTVLLAACSLSDEVGEVDSASAVGNIGS